MTWQALPGVAPCLLGESPLWHPAEQVLYWCDIPGKALHRFDPRTGAHRLWPFDSEPSCCVPLMDGGLLVALRLLVPCLLDALRLLAPCLLVALSLLMKQFGALSLLALLLDDA